MTNSIREAAQALLSSWDEHGQYYMGARINALRDALSAPQPTADERVAEHMRMVEEYVEDSIGFATMPGHASMETAERAEDRCFNKRGEIMQSARALLSASQEDVEHAAMYRWIRVHGEPDESLGYRVDWSNELYDAAIHAAMSAKETK